MDDKEPKKKIQIGTIVHFERGKKSSSEMTTKSSDLFMLIGRQNCKKHKMK